MSATGPRYDTIGDGYAAHRRPDPRIAAAVHAALGGARTVLDVGAGSGSYEPTDRPVVALEPSRTMHAQRPPDAGPVVEGVAEGLPFASGSFDAAMAILTHHHWTDVDRGFAEIRRVARRVVVLTWDPDAVRAANLWLARDYFPDLHGDLYVEPALPEARRAFPGATVVPVPIPHDCTDGFMAAYWARPEAYLDAGVRGAISSFARRDPAVLGPGLARLRADLASGAWAARNADLRGRVSLDLGYRLLVADW